MLPQKNESDKEHVRTATLACMVLQNVCLMQADSIPRKLDLSFGPDGKEKEDRDEIRRLLLMRVRKNVHEESLVWTTAKRDLNQFPSPLFSWNLLIPVAVCMVSAAFLQSLTHFLNFVRSCFTPNSNSLPLAVALFSIRSKFLHKFHHSLDTW